MKRFIITIATCIILVFSGYVIAEFYTTGIISTGNIQSPTYTGNSLDVGASTLATRSLTVDTGGVFNIDLGGAAGDDFTVDTSAFVVSGDTGYVGIGTATPDKRLQVASSVAGADVAIRVRALNDASAGRSFDMNWDPDARTMALGESGELVVKEREVGIGVTPTNRNNTVLQIKDGIGFPSTAVASTDPNTLDGYEEGEFAVTATVGTGTLTVNTAKNTLAYTKIGRVVTITGELTFSTATTPTGDVYFGELPFALAALTEGAEGSAMATRLVNTVSAIAGYVTCGVNGTKLYLREGGTTGTGNDLADHFDTGSNLIISGSYFSDQADAS